MKINKIFSIKNQNKHKVITIFGIKLKFKFINFYKLNYDNIFTLGYNCELAFRLKDIFNDNFEHYLFTWAYVYDRKKLPDILKNLDVIWQDNFIPQNSMILAENYAMAFHPRKKEFIKPDGSIDELVYQKELQELISRIKYLGTKSKNIFSKNKSTIFVIKIKHHTIEDDADFIKSLHNTLKELYISNNFKLLCVVEEVDYTENKFSQLKSIVNDYCFLEKVKEFAPNSQTDTGGDIKGWNDIYKKYFCKYYYRIFQ